MEVFIRPPITSIWFQTVRLKCIRHTVLTQSKLLRVKEQIKSVVDSYNSLSIRGIY